MRNMLTGIAVLAIFCGTIQLGAAEEKKGTRTLRFVQDDAQDYMVSKIYMLKYVQSNDIMPFVTSIVKRYNMNSVVNCIEYGNNNLQYLTVTCPVKMMPYVDDFIEKVDRKIEIDGHVPGEIIRGTGITRAVYRPKYRSGQDLVNVIVNAVINEGPFGSVYGYDKNSNQIYWKDNSTNSEFMFQFLSWLDRPASQIHLHFDVHEIRESTLRDIGIEYLAWKNGPGLNLFQTAWDAFGISSGGTAALQAATGPIGGFFFAPQFDASFLRFLQQSGKAEVRNSADLTVSNSDSRTYQLLFNPQFQNITKSDNDRTSVGPSAISSLPEGMSQLCLSVIQPIVCLHASGGEVDFEIPPYKPGMNAGAPGVLFFGYDLQAGNVVERNTYGNELIETSQFTGNMTLELNREKILASWDKTEKVEQTIGVPFLCEIPILKYLFSTTTTETVKTRVYLTVRAELLNTGIPSAGIGKLRKLK